MTFDFLKLGLNGIRESFESFRVEAQQIMRHVEDLAHEFGDAVGIGHGSLLTEHINTTVRGAQQ